MLLTRLRGVVSTSDSPLRGLFEPDDAWLATGDLFRADEDGDLWLVDHAARADPHRARPRRRVSDHRRARRRRGDRPGGRLRRPDPDGERSLAVAAVTVRGGIRASTPAAVSEALAVLPPDERPDIVHVVDEIPVTTWYRPSTAALRAAGVPAPDGVVWRREPNRTNVPEYVPGGPLRDVRDG